MRRLFLAAIMLIILLGCSTPNSTAADEAKQLKEENEVLRSNVKKLEEENEALKMADHDNTVIGGKISDNVSVKYNHDEAYLGAQDETYEYVLVTVFQGKAYLYRVEKAKLAGFLEKQDEIYAKDALPAIVVENGIITDVRDID